MHKKNRRSGVSSPPIPIKKKATVLINSTTREQEKLRIPEAPGMPGTLFPPISFSN